LHAELWIRARLGLAIGDESSGPERMRAVAGAV